MSSHVVYRKIRKRTSIGVSFVQHVEQKQSSSVPVAQLAENKNFFNSLHLGCEPAENSFITTARKKSHFKSYSSQPKTKDELPSNLKTFDSLRHHLSRNYHAIELVFQTNPTFQICQSAKLHQNTPSPPPPESIKATPPWSNSLKAIQPTIPTLISKLEMEPIKRYKKYSSRPDDENNTSHRAVSTSITSYHVTPRHIKHITSHPAISRNIISN